MPFLPRVLTLGDEKALEQFVLPVPCIEYPLFPLSDLPRRSLNDAITREALLERLRAGEKEGIWRLLGEGREYVITNL